MRCPTNPVRFKAPCATSSDAAPRPSIPASVSQLSSIEREANLPSMEGLLMSTKAFDEEPSELLTAFDFGGTSEALPKPPHGN